MNELCRETKNKLLIKKYVNGYFSLDEASKELFRERLIYNREIAPEHREIIGDAPDLRKRVAVPVENYETFDDGWKTFKHYFGAFINNLEVTYKDFYENKVTINKNRVKLKKALVDFHLNTPRLLFESGVARLAFDFQGNVENELASFFLSEKEMARLYRVAWDGNTIVFRLTPEEAIFADSDTVQKKRAELKPFIERIILKLLEKVGTQALAKNRNLEIVYSLNYADWFMVSTGETWSSCISLDSGYCEAFWAGLPSLVGDKNRALVYLTDGKKKNYLGIEVDRIISRSWVMLFRDKSERPNPTKMLWARTYPGSMDLPSIAKEAFSLQGKLFTTSEKEGKLVGKYYTEMFYHKVKFTGHLVCSIYHDMMGLKLAKKNKAEHLPWNYGYYTYGGGGRPYFGYVENIGGIRSPLHTMAFNSENGLSDLIENGTEVSDFYGVEDDYDDEWDDDYYDEDDYDDEVV